MVEIKFDRYYNYKDLTNTLNSFVKEYPSTAKIRSIGKTSKGRELWLMEVTNSDTGPSESKPAVWIDGNTHAGEVFGSMVCMKTIWYLLENYQKRDDIRVMLDSTSFYILPRIDVDGAEFVLTTPYYVLGGDNETGGGRWYPLSENEWRTNEHGLYLEDIDGDGFIVSMRLKDNAGEWKISEKDKRIMVLRNSDEVEGDFYRVYPEGLILNYEGEKEIEMAPPRWSLNFNRNYPGEWAKEETSKGSGPYPLSEPETRAVADFIVNHPNIAIAVTYHTHGGVLLSYSEDEQIPAQDKKLFKILEDIFQRTTGYPSVSMRRQGLGGAFSTYLSVHRAIPCMTVELWDLAGRIGLGNWVERGGFNTSSRYDQEEQLHKLAEWNQKELNGDGFIDWHEFNHPQLGKVEIGGWKKKFLWRNPPIKFMETEIDKNMLFPIKCAELLPKIKISKTSIEKIKNQIYEIRATVENIGALPTYIMKHAIDIEVASQVEIIIEHANHVRILNGNEIKKFQLEGFMNKVITDERSERKNIEEKNKKIFKWIIKALKDEEINILVKSMKAGTVKNRVKIS
jgi:hypothetical protein